ncbi:MAG TPA: hypothetical protein VFZ61_13455, partial [Polyangiales bacterium]
MTTPKRPSTTARKQTGTLAAKPQRKSAAKPQRAVKAPTKPVRGKPAPASSPAAARGKTHTGHAAEIAARLARAVPEALCELRFESPFQLLIATILSAQSTDARVNMVTPALFKRYPTPKALGSAALPEVEEL